MKVRAAIGAVLALMLVVAGDQVCRAGEAPKGAQQAAKQISIRGRVVDVGGKPLAGAVLRVWKKGKSVFLRPQPAEAVQLGGGGPLRTGPDGRFETPVVLDATSEVCVVVQAENMLGERSGWFKPGSASAPSLENLTLRRLVSVEGRVVDRRGMGVAGARVFQSGDAHVRTEATSDDAGGFRVSGVPEGKAFLFVTKPGFRFQGRAIDTSAKRVELTVRRVDDPAPPLRTLPPVVSQDEAVRLARLAMEPWWTKALKSGTDDEVYAAATWYASIDPWYVMDHVGERLKAKRLVFWIMPELYRADREEAVALLEAQEDPLGKALWYYRLFLQVAEPSRERRLDLLGRAARHARAVGDPEERVRLLAGVAEGLFDVGEVERSRSLLAEIRPIAEQLPSKDAARPRGAVAAALCVFDLPEAMRLSAEDGEGDEFERWRFRIARRIAASHPSEAEQIVQVTCDRALASSRREFKKSQHRAATEDDMSWTREYCGIKTVPVCYRMAAVDRRRARRLAESIRHPEQKAYALGMTAAALGRADRGLAGELVAEAYETLRQAAYGQDRQVWSRLSAAGVGAALLPVVEEVQPEAVEERLWECVSWRVARPLERFVGVDVELGDSVLGLFAARYDREVARGVLASVVDRARKGYFMPGWPAVAGLAMVDPEQAIGLVGSLKETPDGLGQNHARRNLTQALTLPRAERWQAFAARLYLWVPNDEVWNANSNVFW